MQKYCRFVSLVMATVMLPTSVPAAPVAAASELSTLTANHRIERFLAQGYVGKAATTGIGASAAYRTANTIFAAKAPANANAAAPMNDSINQDLLKAAQQRQVQEATQGSLLGSEGELRRFVTPAEIADWKHQLQMGSGSSDQRAVLHFRVGEYELVHDEQPAQAIEHFEQAKSLASKGASAAGIAAFDEALAHYISGSYASASAEFKALLSPRSAIQGYDRRACSRWFKLADAGAGYHRERAQAGIPEPPKLDPLCAAAALAASIKPLGLVSDKKRILSVCRVTGDGSNLQDILDAAARLRLHAYALQADDQGLRALPKPVVAYVEHDHYIAVTGADDRGVTYLCSDCGPWPGGEVRLSWKQWRMMDAGLYVVVAQPGGGVDLAMRDRSLREAYAGPDARLRQTEMAHTLLTLAIQRGHVVRQSTINPSAPVNSGAGPCGGKNRIPNPYQSDQPSNGEPVYLATGEEEHTPDPDLVVYNPQGPSVTWQRVYGSLRSPGQDYTGGDPFYECDDFGIGWSQSYNLGVYDPSSGGTGTSNTKYLYFPDGKLATFTAPSTPTATSPVQCNVQSGTGVLVEWDYDSSSSSGHYTITFRDRTKWITGTANPKLCFEPAIITDRNGNSIYLNYGSPAAGSVWPLLSSITTGRSGSGTQLLTVQRATDGSGNVVSVTDSYGRSVYYHVQWFANKNVPSPSPQYYPELDNVSQIVPTDTANPSFRYQLGYTLVANSDPGVGLGGEQVVFLNTITSPSPTGTGNSVFTIAYDPATEAVHTTTDANGNITTYAWEYETSGIYGTSAPFCDVKISSDLEYYSSYDNNLNPTWYCFPTATFASGQFAYASATYNSSGTDPYKPTSITDKHGTTQYTWDSNANLLTSTTASGVTTTYNFSYSSFALGELTSVVQKGSNGQQKTATLLAYYEPSGLVHTLSTPTPGTVGGSQVVTTYTYDSLGNVLTIQTPGNNGASTITTTLNYTTDGAFTQADAVGQPLTVTDNLGKVTHLRYDAQGNIASVIDALSNEWDYSYNIANQPLVAMAPATGESGVGRSYFTSNYLYVGGPQVSSQSYDERNSTPPVYPSPYGPIRETDYTYGKQNELLSVVGGGEPVSYGYDADYRVKTLTDGNSHTTTYTYTDFNDVATTSYPNVNTSTGFDRISLAYDQYGRCTSRTDGNGVVTQYSYSADGLPVTVQYPTTSNNVYLSYDGFDRVAGMSDATAGTSTIPGSVYTYDDNDFLLSSSVTYTGLPQRSISYTYWPDGTRASMVTPAGTFSYDYDGVGRLNQLTNPFSETSTWGYRDNGWLQTQTLSNGSYTTYTLNALGLTTDLKTLKSDNTTVLSEFSVPSTSGYDGVGNLLSLTASLPAATTYNGTNTYAYDTKNQLTSEVSTRNGGYTNSFAYDGGATPGAGNPTTLRGVSVSYNSDNQNNAYTWDGNGNPTTYKGNTLTFDVENRMTSYGTTLTAGYNAWSLRAWKQPSGGSKTYFLYDGMQPVCELDGSGNVTATNTFGANGLLSRRVSSSSTFYTFDMQGGVAQRLNSSQTVLGSSMFDAFGNGIGITSDPFSGYEAQWGSYTDTETGLVSCDLRYYDGGTGRFVNRDPIGYVGGINIYGYCVNNPIRYTDPLGLNSWGATIAGTVAGVTVGIVLTAIYMASVPATGGTSLAGAVFVNAGIGAISGAVTNYVADGYDGADDAQKDSDAGKGAFTGAIGGLGTGALFNGPLANGASKGLARLVKPGAGGEDLAPGGPGGFGGFGLGSSKPGRPGGSIPGGGVGSYHGPMNPGGRGLNWGNPNNPGASHGPLNPGGRGIGWRNCGM
jgi:RHS repeat-associated protein